MRVLAGLCLVVATVGCASGPAFEPTAEFLADVYTPRFISPRPATIATLGLNLPLRAGDRIIADCAEFFSEELPEMEAEDKAAFESSVACVYPPAGQSMASGQYYYRALAERGFEDDSGTYVQSGMRILCNRTHSVSVAFKGKFIPPSVMNEAGETIEIEGGGDFAHDTIMIAVSDRPCERYETAASVGLSEAPAPDGYAKFPQPAFVEPFPAKVSWGDFDLPLRSGDRVVSHCGQYYAEELNFGPDTSPAKFAGFNHDQRCIYLQGGVQEAAGHYLKLLADAGLATESPWATPRTEAHLPPEAQAGPYAWSGLVSRCGEAKSVTMRALARFGRFMLLDPLTGETWLTAPGRGRMNLIVGHQLRHPVLILSVSPMGCEIKG